MLKGGEINEGKYCQNISCNILQYGHWRDNESMKVQIQLFLVIYNVIKGVPDIS